MSGFIDRLQDGRSDPSVRARVLEMSDADADDVLDALASDTGRNALTALFEEPSTPSELAACIDTSVQNVHYHLRNLREAGLVEPVDTVYSEKGNEMTVYGPTTDPLVFVGDEGRAPRVQDTLRRVVGGFALLGVASLFVQWGAERLVRTGASSSSAVGPASWTPGAARPAETLGWAVFRVLEPGVVFFVAGLVVAFAALWWADRR